MAGEAWATIGDGRRLETVGGVVLRYGLVAVLAGFGVMKFFAFEADAIRPLMANSPFFSWLLAAFGVLGASKVIGMSELMTAGLIAARRWSPRASAVGSLLAVGTFLGTLSFLFTTPGAWVAAPGFPVRVPSETGGFLVKDVLLLGAAVCSAGEAVVAARERRAGPVGTGRVEEAGRHPGDEIDRASAVGAGADPQPGPGVTGPRPRQV